MLQIPLNLILPLHSLPGQKSTWIQMHLFDKNVTGTKTVDRFELNPKWCRLSAVLYIHIPRIVTEICSKLIFC